MSNTPPPMPCRWTGDSFVPTAQHWERIADKHFTIGEVYKLEVREDRSINSHQHYFAAVHQAWTNLPESLAARFLTSEHLRKFALINCGYRDERSISCVSKDDARRMAAFVAPIDDFAVVTTSDRIVTIWTAKSQSYRTMGKKDFQASKDAVLGYVADLIGSTATALAKNAEAAA